MSTKKKIESLKQMLECMNGFTVALAALIENEEEDSKVLNIGETPEETTPNIAPASVSGVVMPNPTTTVQDEKAGGNDDNLDEMTTQELRALAKDMGIRPIVGVNREVLLEKIREASKEDNSVAEGENAVEELPEDDLMKQIKDMTEDMTDDELREVLRDSEISDKGDRTALLSKLYDGVKSGVIDINDDETAVDSENDETEDDEVVSTDGTEITKEEETINNVQEESAEEETNEQEDTPERLQTIKDFQKENREDFEAGKLQLTEMKQLLKENFNITMTKKNTPEEVFAKYNEMVANFVDDEGNVVEEGVYYIKGVPYCCGVPLETREENNGQVVGYCPICNITYDATEE